MNSIIDKINNSGWADWSIDKFEIDYDKVLISLSGEEQNVVTISCKDFIGFSFIGHWDESIIEDIKVEMQGSLVDESLQVVKKLYGETPIIGGGVKKIDDIWHQINIKLIDGNVIKVGCRTIEVTTE
jgi:hypothetical protein